MADTYISVGKLGKPHGIRGAFRFLLFMSRKSGRLPGHFYIFENGQYMPYFLKDVAWHTEDSGLIRFEEITTPENARRFSGHELYLKASETSEFFRQQRGEWDFLMSYKVIDELLGEIGQITAIEEMPAQYLLTVTAGNRTYIIPVADAFIVKIRRRQKEIVMRLPDGLLDI